MRKFALSFAMCISLLIFAQGCGSPDNPILGKWKLDMEASGEDLKRALQGIADYDKFKEKGTPFEFTLEYLEDRVIFSLNGEKIHEMRISYALQGKTWVTCLPDGTNCDRVRFYDKDTMLFLIDPARGANLIMRRQ